MFICAVQFMSDNGIERYSGRFKELIDLKHEFTQVFGSRVSKEMFSCEFKAFEEFYDDHPATSTFYLERMFDYFTCVIRITYEKVCCGEWFIKTHLTEGPFEEWANKINKEK